MKKNFLVLLTVVLTITTSLILDFGADNNNGLNFLFVSCISVVLIINGVKFLLWAFIHKNFDLSKSYPVTAIFFPMIYLAAIFKDEAELELHKISGITLILIGILIFEKNSNE